MSPTMYMPLAQCGQAPRKLTIGVRGGARPAANLARSLADALGARRSATRR